MDSFNMYLNLRQEYSFNRTAMCSQKINDIDKLIRQICWEISVKSFVMEESSFIRGVMQTVEQMESGDRVRIRTIHMIDAHILLRGVLEYLKNQNFTVASYPRELLENLFTVSEPEKGQVERLSEIKCILERLRTKLDEERKKRNFSSKRTPTNNMVQTQSAGYRDRKDEVYKDSYERKRPVSGNNEERKRQNRLNVQEWHEEQSRISRKLTEMQPSIRQLLQSFMSFSDNITEQYVLQFAKMQIGMFNRIADVYAYHKENARFSRNQDYMNAIDNYNEIMLDIIESLSVFGIEEICSSPDACFDGAIHEPDMQSFSTKDAKIEESIRVGFRYKNIMIQKEKVKIKE